MKKKLPLRKIVYTGFVLAIAGIVSSYVAGPPPATTCAPLETKCSTNGLCHVSPPNSGPGFGEITIMGGVPTNGYVPGNTYSLMPFLITNDAAKIKSGFEIVARLESSGSRAGNVIITSPSKTQSVNYNNYEYVEQTANGAINPGMHDWMYNWTAPASGSGSVIFYAAFIAADGDGTASGDLIYTDTLVLPEAPIGINEYASEALPFSVYPNPATTHINIEFGEVMPQPVTLSVFSIDGNLIIKRNISILSAHYVYSVPVNELVSGIYAIVIHSNDESAGVLSLKRFVKL